MVTSRCSYQRSAEGETTLGWYDSMHTLGSINIGRRQDNHSTPLLLPLHLYTPHDCSQLSLLVHVVLANNCSFIRLEKSLLYSYICLRSFFSIDFDFSYFINTLKFHIGPCASRAFGFALETTHLDTAPFAFTSESVCHQPFDSHLGQRSFLSLPADRDHDVDVVNTTSGVRLRRHLY